MTKKEKQQEYKLKSRYGITLKQYKVISKSQKNCCAICNKPQSKLKKKLCVDHNHKTGFIRGLLCPYCNSKLLKYLRDDKERAIGLLKYLERAVYEDKDWI